MHKPPFKGIGIQMTSFAGSAGLDQQLIGAWQHGKVLLTGKQRFESLQFRRVQITTAGTIHLETQMVGQKIR